MARQASVESYLNPPPNSFWWWKDQGEVLAWVDGTTIAFRDELAEALARQVDVGLPPLGAVALLFAATRDSWRETSSQIGMLLGMQINVDASGEWVDRVTETMQQLDRIAFLPAELRHPPAAKAILAEMVFEQCQDRVPPAQAIAIVEELRQPWRDEPHAVPTLREDGRTTVARDLHVLLEGIRRIDEESLRLRMKTGLDELPQSATLELPHAERVRALLAELQSDTELSGLAKLALNLMAAVTVPRHLADHDELQAGGVSDITNRGPLDRLLLSELAHDHLTLAVRIAVNEALYLRRESPPRTPRRQRVLLLDAGIRSWGVPRVFGTAVALAFAATADPCDDIVAYRAKQDRVEPVDLMTRAGLVAHLKVLESDLHPAWALNAFCEQIGNSEIASEAILITSDDVLEDVQCQQAISAQLSMPLQIASVNREGGFQLSQRTARGTKRLKTAQMELEQLLREPARVVDRDWIRDLPAIFSLKSFPLLLSHSVNPQKIWRIEPVKPGMKNALVLSLSQDGRLMFWLGKGHGAQQIADSIPPGGLWWASRKIEDQRTWAVVGHLAPDGLHLLEINLAKFECTSRPLGIDRGVRCITSHRGGLFAIFRDKVQVVSQETGEVIDAFDLPADMHWERDRFFRGPPGGRWYALSYDGRAAELKPVLDEKAMRCPKLLTLFEQDGAEGILGITARGDLYSAATGEVREVSHLLDGQIEVQAIAPSGRWVVLKSHPPTPGYIPVRATLVDVETLSVQPYHKPSAGIDLEYRDVVRTRNLRNRFTHIGLAPTHDGVLTLTSRKQQLLDIRYESVSKSIRLQPRRNVTGIVCRRAFSPVQTPPEIGYRLSRAVWDDGSDAFLDSRGLLHLRSSDRSIPEVSIVLTDGELAGWCSDGRYWGQSYFAGLSRPLAPSKRGVFETIQAFAARLK